jgi:GH25 family lysozyme M1 (1,4-beta-N-acetylmuramidase)
MNIFEGIIDVYDGNDLDLADAWSRGVRAIFHQTTRGLYKKDSAYAARKQAATQMGFLWGGYHLLSAEDPAQQLDYFLSVEDGSNPRVALAIDWEKSKKGMMSYQQLRAFVTLFNTKMKARYPDRYPMLYGGNVIRETQGILNGDPLLAKCPLWYVRYTNGALQIPAKTWPDYTVWQFDDEKRRYGAPPPSVLPGADFNRFRGTAEQLALAWPFSAPNAAPQPAAIAGAAPAPMAGLAAAAAAPAASHFAAAATMTATQEWNYFGNQTYDIQGQLTHLGHKEGEGPSEPGGKNWYKRVGDYWLQGVNMSGIDGRDHNMPWSAAFISWVMKTAGAGDRFRYSSQHSAYIYQAIRDLLRQRPTAGYWCWRLNELKPSVGDIVCWSRQSGIDYEHQNNGDYAGHCDLIVQVDAAQVQVIGGNVGDSVTKRPLALNAAGFLAPTVQHGETLFAVMQNRIP